jgi:hypothetical protein
MNNLEQANETYGRAVCGQSVMNYAEIIHGFSEMGIEVSEIKPRENVFTFNVWRFKFNRIVKKGQHGVRIVTFIPMEFEDKQHPEKKPRTIARPRTAVVFHISQTEPMRE